METKELEVDEMDEWPDYYTFPMMTQDGVYARRCRDCGALIPLEGEGMV